MDNKIRHLLLLVLPVISSISAVAQAADTTTNMNSVMRSNNKIYVVMAVCVTILFGLIIYLIRIDRKVSKAEIL